MDLKYTKSIVQKVVRHAWRANYKEPSAMFTEPIKESTWLCTKSFVQKTKDKQLCTDKL